MLLPLRTCFPYIHRPVTGGLLPKIQSWVPIQVPRKIRTRDLSTPQPHPFVAGDVPTACQQPRTAIPTETSPRCDTARSQQSARHSEHHQEGRSDEDPRAHLACPGRLPSDGLASLEEQGWCSGRSDEGARRLTASGVMCR
jgi:hypothetical protein